MDGAKSGGRMKILLVEDNPGDARLLREIFKEQVSHAAELTHVETMAAAEAHVAAHAADVIVLDLGLPDAQGLAAVRRARATAPLVPLVVLTGYDNELLATQALQHGVQDYLVKGQIESRGLIRHCAMRSSGRQWKASWSRRATRRSGRTVPSRDSWPA